MKLNAHEICSVDTKGMHYRIPLLDRNTADATVEEIDIDGYLFQGLVISNGPNGDVTTIINLNNGMVFDLIPPQPYFAEEAEQRQATAAEVEELNRCLEA